MKVFKSVLSMALMLCFLTTTYGQGKVFTTDKNVAINGYDLVAYFNNYDAVRGSKEHSITLEGVDYYFSSAENATAFKANPSAYQPAYGGYCSFAMGMGGSKVPADPATFKIRDGKLYLFYNDFYEGKPFNTIVPWNANEAAMVAKAAVNWKGLKH